MFRTLVVVADSGKARIYGLEMKGKPMHELADLLHVEARIHENKLVSDRPGRTFDSRGSARHAKEASSSLKVQEAIKFAQQISAYIDAERIKHNFNDLVLVAPPEFLGILRKTLGREAGKLVSREIDKNLVLRQESAVRGYLSA